jgi:multimeric flavodoxin WrbA
MKTLILDGSQSTDPTGGAVHAALVEALEARGAALESVRLAERHIGPCMGDFFCWVRSPGQCVQDDDNRAIAAAVVQSDLVVLLTPVTFGGYSSALKRAVDHLIQNISPYFAVVDGEVHHQRRYRRYPRLLVIGWLPGPDPDGEATFEHLAGRNALNFYAPAAAGGVVYAGQDPADIRRAVSGWLGCVLTGKGHPQASLPVETLAGPGDAPRRALLLVGSPRGKNSTSQALGGYLYERLAAQGVQTETIRLYTVLKSPDRRQMLLDAVSQADLVTLAFPLYVDSLPAPVISVLETLAAQRGERATAPAQRFTAIVNCGFPEAAHTRTALAICRNFARLNGFAWAGGLALGGGEMVHGTPLDELDGRAIPLKRSLELAGAALAAGRPVPPEAVALMARPVIPPWLYRLFGGRGWKQQAKRYHAQDRLKAQPYA